MKCELCGSTQIGFDEQHRLPACMNMDCWARKIDGEWKQLTGDEIKGLPTFLPLFTRNITEKDAENWWKIRPPDERYYGLGYSGMPKDGIIQVFGGDWSQLPEDVRRDFVIYMRHNAN